MLECDFRGNKPETRVQKGNVTIISQSSITINGQPIPICGILQQLGRYGFQAACIRKDFSTEDCPIAQYGLGNISTDAANIRLKALGLLK